MNPLRLTGLALAACLAAAPFAAQAQPMPGPAMPYQPGPSPRVDFYSGTPVYTPGDEGGVAAAQQNIIDSRRYEAMLRSDPGFRQQRIQRECGSFTDPSAYRGCVDSFGDRTAAVDRYDNPPAGNLPAGGGDQQ
jgi:hypothetical protein